MTLTPQQKQVMHEVHMGLKGPPDLMKAGLRQQDVIDEFGAESPIAKDFQLLVRSRAHQISLADLLAVKEEFLQAAGDYYQHRTGKRAFKKGLRRGTLAKVRKDLLRREKQLAKKKVLTPKDNDRLAKLKTHQAKLAELEQQKAEQQKAYDRARRKFIDLLDAQIEYLDGQLKHARTIIEKPLAQLDAQRARQRKLIRDANGVFLEQWKKDAGWGLPAVTGRVHAAHAYRSRLLGAPTLTDAEVGAVPHPYDRLTDAQRGSYDDMKALRRLKVYDQQRDKLTYQYDVIRCELQQLRQMRSLVANAAALWKFVDGISRWVPHLMMLAESVTSFSRPVPVIAGKAPNPLSQTNRCTGSRDFTLELGVGYGIEKDIAQLELGLAVVLTGSLGMQDDRRLKANLTLQLVPSFTAKIDTPVLTIDLAATLGFTITSQTYAFVDERHFAYYMAFRIANLLNFTDKFTRYGKAALHQHVGVYTPEMKTLLKKMVGEGGYREMETYLTESPVIKATLLQNWKPDLGFSGSVSAGIDTGGDTTIDVAGGVSVSASLKHETLFERSQLVVRPDGEQPYMLASRRKGSSWSYAVALEGNVTSWLSGGIEVNLSKIDNDANPDNNGLYLTFTLKSQPFGLLPGMLPVMDPADGDPAFFQVLGTGSGGAPPKKPLDIAEIRAAVLGALKIAANAVQGYAYDATQNWSFSVGDHFEIAHTTERTLVIACQVESKWPLQVSVMYIRWMYTTGTSVSASGAAETPYGDVALKGSLAWSKSVALQEWLGPSSMAYLQPAFNGYRLRPNGRQQWQALLDEHPHGLRAIFRNIGKKAGNPDDDLNVRKEVQGYEEQVNGDEYKHIWQDRPYWDDRLDAGTGNGSFVALCESKRGALKQFTEPGKVSRLKRRFRRVPGGVLAELDVMKKELTTLLWRREQVADHLESLKSPWQQRRTYLEQASGALLFRLRWDQRAGCYRVVKAPKLKPSQGSRYRSVEDIYLNPKLFNATSLQPFYEAGFDVYIRIDRRKKNPLPGTSPTKRMFTMRLRQPHGVDILERAFRAMIAEIAAAANPDTNRLLALVRLHPKLESHLMKWIVAQDARGRANASAKRMTSKEKKAAKAAAKLAPPPAPDDVQRKALDEALKLFDEWLLNPTAPGSPGAALEDAIVLALASVKATFVGYRVAGLLDD